MSNMLNAGDRILGRFDVVEWIGSGGVGEVYKVSEGDRRYALKVLLPRVVAGYVDLESISRSLIPSGCKDTAAETPLEVFEDSGRKCVLREFVVGRSLREIMDARKDAAQAFDSLEAFLFIDRLLQALSALPPGMVHGGLRPENILLRKTDPADSSLGGEIRITDYGFSKIMAFSKYAWIQLSRGTPYHYLAPEFVSLGGRIDPRADIYAVAVLAYELAVARVHQKTYLPMKQFGWDGPEAMDAVLARALAKSPEDRPLRFKDFQNEIRAAFPDMARVLADAPVELSAVDVFTGKKESTVQVDVRNIGEIDAFSPSAAESAAKSEESEPAKTAMWSVEQKPVPMPKIELVLEESEAPAAPPARGAINRAHGANEDREMPAAPPDIESAKPPKRFGCLGAAALLTIPVVIVSVLLCFLIF